MSKSTNYSKDRGTLENFNTNDKYSETGESEFSRESTIPVDQDEVLSVRHYNIGSLENHGRQKMRTREHKDHATYDLSLGSGPHGYRRTDDMIKSDVREILYRHSEIDASLIEVIVKNSAVTLKGTVEDETQKSLAESAVKSLAGVENIYNELFIAGDKKIQ